ncbi:MAG: nucleotidyltransferase domain-containing protein [Candidatus Omnitrophota bacterium]|nr:nucleotidyltransferase domain-containing protein [Candidatus Omnitrophota bacterium]
MRIAVDETQLAELCQRWKVRELDFFGSVLREDFGPSSDVDVLVSFAPEANWGLLDHLQMEAELSALLGRKVELVSRRAIERSPNWIRRRAILDSAKPYYVAQ